jgi:hypothetical protein
LGPLSAGAKQAIQAEARGKKVSPEQQHALEQAAVEFVTQKAPPSGNTLLESEKAVPKERPGFVASSFGCPSRADYLQLLRKLLRMAEEALPVDAERQLQPCCKLTSALETASISALVVQSEDGPCRSVYLAAHAGLQDPSSALAANNLGVALQGIDTTLPRGFQVLIGRSFESGSVLAGELPCAVLCALLVPK